MWFQGDTFNVVQHGETITGKHFGRPRAKVMKKPRSAERGFLLFLTAES
jgi:hypothetical protein